MVKADHPSYKWVRVDEPYELLIKRVQEAHAEAILQDGMAAATDAYDVGDLGEVKRILSATLTSLEKSTISTRDIDITHNASDRLERYQAYARSGSELLGLPTGFATIDRATGGLQPEHLVVIVGPPKAGKSTLEMLVARAAQMHGVATLNIGFEMSNDENTERFDAIAAGISAKRLRNGTLTKEEEERLQRALRQQELMPSFWLSSDSMSATTLTGIAAKVEHYKPAAVFVDGVYMMVDEDSGERNTPRALTNLTRGFKRLAQNAQIPVVITTQALIWKMDKKKGLTANSIGYSSSFAQDANTVLGAETTDDPTIQKLKVVLARNCPPMETYVRWDWETATFEELDSAVDDDDGQDAGV